LTKGRSEPAVPLAGTYRLVDIPISNCLNSGCNRIFVLTQFQSVSLHRHLAQTYKFDPFSQGFVEILAAQQTNEAADWYQGTADAVRQNIRYVQEDGCQEVLILSSDQLYRLDFRLVLHEHRERQADVTIAVAPVRRDQASGLGIVAIDSDLRIRRFIEKPANDQQLEPFRLAPEWFSARRTMARGREYLANMGIYVFSRQVLFDLLAVQPRAADFARDLFPNILEWRRVQAFVFDGYWEDLGTIRSYHSSSLALASDDPSFDFHSAEGVIYTRMRFLPAAQIQGAHLEQCLVSDGCIVRAGARLERCVLGVRSRIGRNAQLKDTVVFGADENDPRAGIGEGSVIERAILDRGCQVGRNVRILNRAKVQEADGPYYLIRDGVVVLPSDAVIPDGVEI
jgi:glucose-1-phosphate adenylyltransferase